MSGVLHDGAPCAEDAAGSRALHYGDGVFRTVLWHARDAVDWTLHLDKLAADCAALQIQMPAPELLKLDLQKLAANANDDARVIKLIVGRKPTGRGYAPTSSDSERWALAYPLSAGAVEHYRDGVEAMLSPVLLSEQPLLAGVKHLNRLDQVLASRAWPASVREALMCDQQGRVICGTRSNLFVVSEGAVLTPRLDRCGVAGIMRRKILECCRQMNLPTQETGLSPQDLGQAQELFLSNALIGIWPVRRLGARTWTAPGPYTRRLMQAIAHPLCATTP